MPDATQPKFKSYCAALYDKLLSESKIEQEYTLWRGHITKTCRSVGMPEGTYRRVITTLEHLGCIEQIERGVRGKTSAILLFKPPTDEVWDGDAEQKVLTRRDSPAILSRRLADLERRLEGLDIKQALADIYKEITNLKNTQGEKS